MKIIIGDHRDSKTVGYLKGILASIPDDVPVVLEGCDCCGFLSGVAALVSEPSTGRFVTGRFVILRRISDGDDDDEIDFEHGNNKLSIVEDGEP